MFKKWSKGVAALIIVGAIIAGGTMAVNTDGSDHPIGSDETPEVALSSALSPPVTQAVSIKAVAAAPLATTDIAPHADAAAILERVDGYRGYQEPFSMAITVTDRGTDGKPGNRLRFTAHIKDRGSSFLQYTYPPVDQGKLLLMVNEAIWFYHKKISKPLRLSQRQRLLGNVSNADVARANFAIDYTPQVRGFEVIDGQKALMLTLTAKHEQVAYAQIIMAVHPRTYRPILGRFYAASGKLLKTSTYDSYQRVGDGEKLQTMTIRDAILTDTQTQIEYRDYQLQALPPHYYNPDFLPRIRQLE